MKKQALALVAAVTIALPAAAQDKDLTTRVEATLAQLAGPGTRFGIVVVDDQGHDIVAINPDARFIPASNTKMFTTATALNTMGDLTQPDTTGGAAVRLDGRDVVLIGNGDARLSGADDCTVDCLTTLADAVAKKTRVVGDVIGDD